MGRLIKDIKRELIHLEHKYQTLSIKTLDYIEVKERLEEELEKEAKLVNEGHAQDLSNYRPSKRPSFTNRLHDKHIDSKNPTAISGEETYDSKLPSDIRN